jgi:molybdopterin/thiamine biosynthesis adenylyltransferase
MEADPMPEPATTVLAHQDAVNLLSDFLEATYPVKELSSNDLAEYVGKSFHYGWELSVRFVDEVRPIRVLVDKAFPFTAPRIALVDRTLFLKWPHVEHDGLLCLSPQNASHSPRLISKGAQDITMFIACATVNGTAIAGMSVPAPRHKSVTGKNKDELTKGFRPGHVPPRLLLSRYFDCDTSVARFEVKRCDHRWIHGRDRNEDSEQLKEKKVVIVGCGSLGSPVALQLAQSGIGSLTLIDSEDLTWPNIARHVLGATAVGINKATAMQKWLSTNFPHLNLAAIPSRIEDALRTHLEVIGGSDLVVNVTGNWNSTVLLSRTLRELLPSPRLLFAWMERHASVGHCLSFLDTKSGCIECGFSDTGVLTNAITAWEEEQANQEPECGAQFDSYGASEVAYCASLACESAVGILTGRATNLQHRIWVGTKARMVQLGGKWTNYWEKHREFRDSGGIITSDS